MILVRNIAFVAVLLMSLFVVIPPADADIYRYVDASGRVHFTDTPTHGRYDMYLKENMEYVSLIDEFMNGRYDFRSSH